MDHRLDQGTDHLLDQAINHLLDQATDHLLARAINHLLDRTTDHLLDQTTDHLMVNLHILINSNSFMLIDYKLVKDRKKIPLLEAFPAKPCKSENEIFKVSKKHLKLKIKCIKTNIKLNQIGSGTLK